MSSINAQEQLKAAIIQIHEALFIISELKKNQNYIPSKTELELLEQISWTFSMGFEKSQHITSTLEKRSCGEAEPPADLNKKSLFTWRVKRPKKI